MTPIQIKRLLNAAGASPKLTVEGPLGPVFGPKSRDAVRAFQRKTGLPVSKTGDVDSKTIAALKAAARAAGATIPDEPSSPPSEPDPASAVPPWMVWARGELGEAEVPGPKSNARIMEYRDLSKAAGREDGEDGSVPWCAIFVNAGLEQCGIRGTRSALARSFEASDDFIRLDGPAVGAIVVYWRKSLASGLGHVQYYDHETAEGRVFGIGGNQGDEVSLAGYPKKAPTSGLRGYFWPRNYPLPVIGPVYKSGLGRTDAGMV